MSPENIAGYQVCGGLTQEWMPFDYTGSFSEMGLKKFNKWLKEKYGKTNTTLLTKNDLICPDFNETVSYYGEFYSEMTARTIEHFAKVLKECITTINAEARRPPRIPTP